LFFSSCVSTQKDNFKLIGSGLSDGDKKLAGFSVLLKKDTENLMMGASFYVDPNEIVEAS